MFKVLLFVAFVAMAQARPDDAPAPDKAKCELQVAGAVRSRCCKHPPTIPRKVFEECGFANDSYTFKEEELKPNPPCDKHICLAKKMDVLVGENGINREVLKMNLEKYATEHPEMKTGVENAIAHCLDLEITEKPDLCQPIKISYCIGIQLIKECPEWDSDDRCTGMKEKLDECKAHF